MSEIIYEYAGFQYKIGGNSDQWEATPVTGQHKAAWKDKHRRAAVECWQQDGCPGLLEKQP